MERQELPISSHDIYRLTRREMNYWWMNIRRRNPWRNLIAITGILTVMITVLGCLTLWWRYSRLGVSGWIAITLTAKHEILLEGAYAMLRGIVEVGIIGVPLVGYMALQARVSSWVQNEKNQSKWLEKAIELSDKLFEPSLKKLILAVSGGIVLVVVVKLISYTPAQSLIKHTWVQIVLGGTILIVGLWAVVLIIILPFKKAVEKNRTWPWNVFMILVVLSLGSLALFAPEGEELFVVIIPSIVAFGLLFFYQVFWFSPRESKKVIARKRLNNYQRAVVPLIITTSILVFIFGTVSFDPVAKFKLVYVKQSVPCKKEESRACSRVLRGILIGTPNVMTAVVKLQKNNIDHQGVILIPTNSITTMTSINNSPVFFNNSKASLFDRISRFLYKKRLVLYPAY